MNKNILIILMLLFIGCKQNAQNFNYELEDSDESYIMDSWSSEQKEDYYKKVGKLLHDFLLRENYKTPTESDFSKKLYDKLNILVNHNKLYQIVPYHILQKDSINNDSPQLIIFPKEKLVSFKSELPLLDKVSIEHYNSSDFKKLDHSKEDNIVLNKLLFSPDQNEIEAWIKSEQLKDLFIYLVCNFHFDNEEKIFQYVIEKIKNTPEKYSNSEYLQLLFQRDKKILDKDFLFKIVTHDTEKKLRIYFINALSDFGHDEQKKFSDEINEIYNSKNFISSNNINIKPYLKKGFQVIDEISADLDGDSDDDKIYLASSQEEMTNLQVLIFKNNNNSFVLWTKNDSFPILGQKEYKRTVTKKNYFSIEYYRDIEEKYNLNNYLTFKFNNNNFTLYKFSQETYDATKNKMLPVKIWTEKNFGTLTFDKITYNFIDSLN